MFIIFVLFGSFLFVFHLHCYWNGINQPLWKFFGIKSIFQLGNFPKSLNTRAAAEYFLDRVQYGTWQCQSVLKRIFFSVYFTFRLSHSIFHILNVLRFRTTRWLSVQLQPPGCMEWISSRCVFVRALFFQTLVPISVHCAKSSKLTYTQHTLTEIWQTCSFYRSLSRSSLIYVRCSFRKRLCFHRENLHVMCSFQSATCPSFRLSIPNSLDVLAVVVLVLVVVVSRYSFYLSILSICIAMHFKCMTDGNTMEEIGLFVFMLIFFFIFSDVCVTSSLHTSLCVSIFI